MKINKESLDRLILEMLKEQTMVSANPLTDPLNPEKQTTLKPKTSSTESSEEKLDPNKIQIEKNVLSGLYNAKEKLRSNLNKMPVAQLVSEVNVLISQLNFLDQFKTKF